MNPILVCSKNEVSKCVRAHRTMLALHSTFQKQGCTLILCVTYRYTFTYRQLGMDQEAEEGFSRYRKISESSVLPQGAQLLIGLLCRSAVFQIRSPFCVFLPTLFFMKCHKCIIYCTSEAIKDLFHTIRL